MPFHNPRPLTGGGDSVILLLDMAACAKCGQEPKIFRVVKCAACFKPVCEGCALRKYGNFFCSKGCAEVYFFGSGEEIKEA